MPVVILKGEDMSIHSSRAFLAVALAGCGGGVNGPLIALDLDLDGLADLDEAELGTAWDNPDTDGDGLSDGDEVLNGADPLVVDTDGDGYTDRDEVAEETDPTDDQSVIYQGGWPYYFEKGKIKGGSYSDPITLGERFARVDLVDQYGDKVDLWDFYNDTKPVVIDLSAQWCVPCQQLTTYLVDDGDPLDWAVYWPAGPDVIRRGDVYWITILGENDDGNPATERTAGEWAESYPSRKMPILAEGDYDTYDYCGANTLPTVVLLEPDLKVALIDLVTPRTLLTELALRFPE